MTATEDEKCERCGALGARRRLAGVLCLDCSKVISGADDRGGGP